MKKSKEWYNEWINNDRKEVENKKSIISRIQE